MTDLEREKKIRAAVESAVGRGLRIISHGWGVVSPAGKGSYQPQAGQCCPMGALIIGEKFGLMWGTAVDAAAKKLDVSVDWVDAFTDGFDGRDDHGFYDHEKNSIAFALGNKLRAEYLEE